MDPESQQPNSSQPDPQISDSEQSVPPQAEPSPDTPPVDPTIASDSTPAPSPTPIPDPVVTPDDGTSLTPPPAPDPAPTVIPPIVNADVPTAPPSAPVDAPIHLGGTVAEMKILTRRAAAARTRLFEEHKERVMEMVEKNGHIDSVTVRLALRVSHSSSTRYFVELIREGHLKRHREGNNVVYEGV